jgi:two-component system, LytTR family, response regulator
MIMIRAVHIEDEPRNIELLENLVNTHCSDMVKLYGHATNTKDAVTLIKTKKPQLVYLDIELNRGNAFELLEKLNAQNELNFHVIFITAFNEYAVKAFRYNAVDYLLKPISIEELKDATSKVVKRIEHAPDNDHILEAIRQLRMSTGPQKIGLPVTDGVIFINCEDIIKAEASGSYSVLYLKNKEKITSTKNLKDVELMLPDTSFVRVHHSWIISIKYLKKYYRGKNGYMEMEDGSTVLVSIRKKGKLLDLF